MRIKRTVLISVATLIIFAAAIYFNRAQALIVTESPIKTVATGKLGQMPASATCKIRSIMSDGSIFVGTGFIIGKKKVLTAAHMVYENGITLKKAYVMPSCGILDPNKSFAVSDIYVNPKWLASNKNSSGYKDSQEDWALLLVNKNLSKYGKFTMKPFKNYNRKYSITWLNGERMALTSGYTELIHYSNGDRPRHKISTVSGASGAPLWYTDKERKYIAIGINTASGSASNAFVPFDRDLIALVNSLKGQNGKLVKK